MFLEIKDRAVNMQHVLSVEKQEGHYSNIYLKKDIENFVTNNHYADDGKFLIDYNDYLENENGVFLINERACVFISDKYCGIKKYTEDFYSLYFNCNGWGYKEQYTNKKNRDSDYEKILSL